MRYGLCLVNCALLLINSFVLVFFDMISFIWWNLLFPFQTMIWQIMTWCIPIFTFFLCFFYCISMIYCLLMYYVIKVRNELNFASFTCLLLLIKILKRYVYFDSCWEDTYSDLFKACCWDWPSPLDVAGTVLLLCLLTSFSSHTLSWYQSLGHRR